MPQIQFGRMLIAGAILAIVGASSALLGPGIVGPSVDVRIEPDSGMYTIGESFTTDIVVEADEPVNVFAGELVFDPALLVVEKIDYNTSIADLWAELPWYSNGDGTLNFAGGSTREGGFEGVGTLITVTFKTRSVGNADIGMKDVRVLRHDGLGTDAAVRAPIDALFTIDRETLAQQTKLEKNALGTKVNVLPEPPKTDLNGDGKQTIVDVSMFMRDLVTQNERSDFNNDGSVNTADLSIILDAE